MSVNTKNRVRSTVADNKEVLERIVIPALYKSLGIMLSLSTMGEQKKTVTTYVGNLPNSDEIIHITFYFNHEALKNIPKSDKCAYVKISNSSSLVDIGICDFEIINVFITKIQIALAYLGYDIKVLKPYMDITVDNLKKEKIKYSIIRIIIAVIVVLFLFSNKLTSDNNYKNNNNINNIVTNSTINNNNSQKIEEKIIKQTTIQGNVIYLKVDTNKKYYLECNGEKIYSITEAKGTSNANSKDTFLEMFDSQYGRILAWSGSYYTIINNKLQRLN